MGMELKAGTRLRSAVDTTEVVVVKAPAEAIDLRCGGQPFVAIDADVTPAGPAAGFDAGTQLGKRYVAADSALEVLCTKAGAGTLTLGESALTVANSKPLPSSD